MDFAPTEMQEMVADLAKQVLRGTIDEASLRAHEESGDWWHRPAWGALAASELLGLSLPEDAGGAGCGMLELCGLLEQVGRTAAPIPALACLVYGALPLAAFGSDAQKAAWLPGVIRGEVVLTAALSEPHSRDPRAPETTAALSDGAWRLTGRKYAVHAAHHAARIVVPARTDAGPRLFLLDPAAEGVTLEAQVGTNHERLGALTLDGAPVEAMGDAGALDWLVDRAQVGLCAVALGLSRQALITTAKYVGQREQFGRKIGTFQAVSHRAADGYIDLSAMELTLQQAAWRLDEGLPAAREIAIARFWAGQGSHRITAAAQHLHGGMGFDRDYPLYRFYLGAKQLEFALGSAPAQLAALGDRIAAGA